MNICCINEQDKRLLRKNISWLKVANRRRRRNLTGTSYTYTIMKGLKVGGQLSQLPMGLTGVFASTSIIMGSAGMVIWIIYLIWGRGWESQVLADKKVILEEMKHRRGRNNIKIMRTNTVSMGEESSTEL